MIRQLSMLAAALVLAGCGACGLDAYCKARQTLTGFELGSQASIKAIDADQGPREDAIFEAAKAACAGKAPIAACVEAAARPKLSKYRGQRDAAKKAFAALERALGLAEIGVSVAELARSPAASVLAAAAPAAREVILALKDLGVSSAALDAVVDILPTKVP